jgi:hypothetical protein
MRIGVRALVGCAAVATAVAAVILIAMPRTASDRPAAIQDARVAAAGPPRADPPSPPPTADPADVAPDRELESSANLFLTVDIVVVTGLWLTIVLSVGWIVVRLVRGGKF